MRSNSKIRRTVPHIWIVIFPLIAFALRIYNLGGRSLWYDELLQLDVAQGPLADIWPQLTRHAAMPLDYYILHGWIYLGRQEFWVRWPALIFGTLAIPLIYTFAGRLFNRRVGLIAAILLTVASFFIQYSQEVRPYALLLFLTLLGYFGLWQAYYTGRQTYWGLVLIGLIGASLTHYFALFMLLPMGLFVACQQLRCLKRADYWQHTASFALCGLLLLVVLLVSGRFKFVYNVSFGVAEAIQNPATLTQTATEKPNRGEGPPLEFGFFVERVFSPLSAGSPPYLLFYNAFLLLAILSLLHRQNPHRAALLLLLGWLVLPILSIYFFLLHRGTFYAVRYILYTLPAYLMLVAYGIDLVARLLFRVWIRFRTFHISPSTLAKGGEKSKIPSTGELGGLMTGLLYKAPAILLLSLSLCLPLLMAEVAELQSYYTAASHEDWRAVGQLLRDQATPEDIVIAVWAEPAINWYYSPASTPFHTYSSSQPIWQAIQEHPRRWFILSSYSQKRDEGLREWLRLNQAVRIGIDRRIVVFIQQEGVTAEELLAQVTTFSLPPKALTYATLARQLSEHGDTETSQTFYQKALELADPETRLLIETQMSASLSQPGVRQF